MTAKLDSFDLKILAELQQNGGLSNQELADRVGLSPSPCSRRIRELEHLGVIRERVVRLDPRAVGLDLTVLIHIRMDRHTPERFAQFESAVRGYPEVLECYLITGQEADYQLKISVPNMDEYQRFLLTKITPAIGMVWHLVRREWRELGIAVGVTAAVVAIGFIVNPGLWRAWFDTLLNVNFPPGAPKGVRATRQGRRVNEVVRSEPMPPAGGEWFTIAEPVPDWREDPDADVFAVRDGYISVTPLHPDLTRHEDVPLVASWRLGLD